MIVGKNAQESQTRVGTFVVLAVALNKGNQKELSRLAMNYLIDK